ncbi:protein timeless homolog isoform X2 [Varanus komodoensis]|uniref:protein timeless homolog isoform X2 n=1 Tax=Varanus komodoensis TaxID=61221 RepID=UPI001CF7C930|nr:protein timeless homolog isoform X2 [Varanus komodoensis]
MDLYMMNCELLATCSALGFLEGDTYHKEPDCLESVKDLIRYLRHEDETRDIRQQLGAAQILQNDLIPIIIQYPQEKQLFDAIIRLMVNLTQPAVLCFGKLPQDASFRHHFLQIVSYLQAYKEAFANEKIFGVLSEKLYDLLQLDWEQRQEEDNLLIERILLLVRNVLHVPADPDEEKSIDDDASTHDRVLWAMHISGMDDLLKFLASSQSEQQWSLHVLEIISLMFRDQKPEQLAATGQGCSAKDRVADVAELEVLRQKELAEKKNRVFQRSSRHSRFGGCYIIQGLKSISDRDVVIHKGLHNLKNYSHDLGKEVHRVPRRRQLAPDSEGTPRRSALNVRIFLKEFCVEFLENCYNRLMYLVKDHLVREKAQQHDETYYLWAIAFFMAFNRACSFQPQLVSETVGVRTFHFIEQSLTNYYEMMLIDKKEATSWSRRMHLALKAYQELLMTVHEMDRSPDEAVRHSSHILKNNIFYVMEYRELFLTLFRKFDETKQPRSFLKDLVETTHLFLKMLEKFCKGRSNLVVQQSKKSKKKKKKALARHTGSDVHSHSPEELEEMWPRLAEQIKKCTEGSEPLPESIVPFDAASEVSMEDQRAEAMIRIQDSLLGGRASEALSLLHSAREVWPEGDIFGSPTLDSEEETELLRRIFSAHLTRQTAPEPDEPEEAAEEEEVAEEELASVQTSEREFNFLDYAKQFARANVVKAYLLLFKSYAQNSSHTNHCVVKMLHRIAYDLKMEALLFQLSAFCLFNRLLSDPAAGAYKELVTFAKYIVGKFFALTSTNKKAYMELLFWKSTAVVREMTEGYTLMREEGSSATCKASQWTEEEEEELRELYYKYKEVEGEDILNNILAHLSTPSRTRKQVAKQLVRLGLARSVRDFPQERKGTRIVLWTQDQESELQRLFEEFRDTDDILANVMRHITAKRSKARIIDKLLSMGLVSDRKELYKKRKRRPGSLGANKEVLPKDFGVPDLDENDDEEEEEEEEDLDSDEEEEPSRGDSDSDMGNRPVNERTSRKWGAASDRDAQELVQSLRQEGLSGPLSWLQSCLNRTAADREEDGSAQPVPLVPLSEENEDAMEHKDFQKLLRKMRLRAPASEQESFWRIPAKLSPEQLRHMAASIAPEVMEGESKDKPTEEDRLDTGEPQCLILEKEEPIQHSQGPKRSHLINDMEEESHSQGSSDEEGPRPSSKRKCLRIEEEEEED